MSQTVFWLRWLFTPTERERIKEIYPEEYDRLAQSENPLHTILEDMEGRGLFLCKLSSDAVPPAHLLGRLERRATAGNRKFGSDCRPANPQAVAPVLSLSLRSPAGGVRGGAVREWNVVLPVGPARDRLLDRREKLRAEYQAALRVWTDEVLVWREGLLTGSSTWPDLRPLASKRVERLRAELEQLDSLLEDPAA